MSPENRRSPESIAAEKLLIAKHTALHEISLLLRRHSGAWVMETFGGFVSVVLDDPRQDKFEYDFFDSGMKYNDINKRDLITELFNRLERTLGARLVSESQWYLLSTRGSEDQQSRLVSYDTNIPNIQIKYTVYRYPNRPDWGTSIRREINRVPATETEC